MSSYLYLTAQEKARFKAIVAGFEKKYRDTNALDNTMDQPIIRTAFYSACYKIVHDGPRMNSDRLQEALVEYYDKLRDEEFRKIPEIAEIIDGK